MSFQRPHDFGAAASADAEKGDPALVAVPFSERCRIDRQLSLAIYGSVVAASDKTTGEPLAVKVASKSRIAGGRVGMLGSHLPVVESPVNELHILRALADNPHPALVCEHPLARRIITDTPQRLLLITPLASNDLMNHLKFNGPIAAETARVQFRQLMRGLRHLHTELGVHHRDISAENVLVYLDAATGEITLKLTDYGLAVPTSAVLVGKAARVGKPTWCAPEVAHLGDGEQVDRERADVYSMSVVLFAMLTGSSPYSKPVPRYDGAFAMVANGQLKELISHWRLDHLVPPEAADLLVRMMSVNPHMRPTVDEVLANAWLSAPSAAEVEAEEAEAKAKAAAASEAYAVASAAGASTPRATVAGGNNNSDVGDVADSDVDEGGGDEHEDGASGNGTASAANVLVTIEAAEDADSNMDGRDVVNATPLTHGFGSGHGFGGGDTLSRSRLQSEAESVLGEDAAAASNGGDEHDDSDDDDEEEDDDDDELGRLTPCAQSTDGAAAAAGDSAVNTSALDTSVASIRSSLTLSLARHHSADLGESESDSDSDYDPSTLVGDNNDVDDLCGSSYDSDRDIGESNGDAAVEVAAIGMHCIGPSSPPRDAM